MPGHRINLHIPELLPELRKLAVENDWPIRDFAKPVAMKSRIDKKQAAAAGAGVALGAVALGIAWYARRRSLRA